MLENSNSGVTEYLRQQLTDEDAAERIMSLAKHVTDHRVAVTADAKGGGRVEVRFRNGCWFLQS